MKDRRSRSGKTLGQDTILSMVDHESGTIFQHIGCKVVPMESQCVGIWETLINKGDSRDASTSTVSRQGKVCPAFLLIMSTLICVKTVHLTISAKVLAADATKII
jgi:hypothetical protein